MERPEPNPHAKAEPTTRADRRAPARPRPIEATRTAAGRAPRRTGAPLHIRQARFNALVALSAEVRRLGIDNTGKSLKQARLAVAKAQRAEQAA